MSDAIDKARAWMGDNAGEAYADWVYDFMAVYGAHCAQEAEQIVESLRGGLQVSSTTCRRRGEERDAALALVADMRTALDRLWESCTTSGSDQQPHLEIRAPHRDEWIAARNILAIPATPREALFKAALDFATNWRAYQHDAGWRAQDEAFRRFCAAEDAAKDAE